jgi:hypothetical protein
MAINNFNVGVGTTSQLTRYRYVATGGETSVSGSDADSKTLSYTVGLEQVFLNGVNLVRGQDYTATDGTSVGSLSALVASDVVEVFAYVPFNIANALTVSTVDAKGDLLVGTADNTIGKLTAGTDGQILSAASGETTGLKWANGGLTLLTTQTFSAVSSVSLPQDTFTTTYTHYKILFNLDSCTAGMVLSAKMRLAGVDTTGNGYNQMSTGAGNNGTDQNNGQSNAASWQISALANLAQTFIVDVSTPKLAQYTTVNGFFAVDTDAIYLGRHLNLLHAFLVAYDSMSFIASTGNIAGSYSVYGYNK